MIEKEVIAVKISCVLEHNGLDSMLYCADYPGAYSRAGSPEEAANKMISEVQSFCRWAGTELSDQLEIEIIQEKATELLIRDADSDVMFESERRPMTREEYECQKELVMQSAADFQRLFDSIPHKELSSNPVRNTFYGSVPRTALEMYNHTKNVNEYYFWEIGVDTDNEGKIAECRARGFEQLERISDFLVRSPVIGSYGEEWSLRKLMRRFLWHDRIHGKAMYRMAIRTFGGDSVSDIFCFRL